MTTRLGAFDADPDSAATRGAKYANLLLGPNLAPGDVVHTVPLERVHPDFFERIEAESDYDLEEDPLYSEFKRNPDVIAVPVNMAVLPDEFHTTTDGNGGGGEDSRREPHPLQRYGKNEGDGE